MDFLRDFRESFNCSYLPFRQILKRLGVWVGVKDIGQKIDHLRWHPHRCSLSVRVEKERGGTLSLLSLSPLSLSLSLLLLTLLSLPLSLLSVVWIWSGGERESVEPSCLDSRVARQREAGEEGETGHNLEKSYFSNFTALKQVLLQVFACLVLNSIWQK